MREEERHEKRVEKLFKYIETQNYACLEQLLGKKDAKDLLQSKKKGTDDIDMEPIHCALKQGNWVIIELLMEKRDTGIEPVKVEDVVKHAKSVAIRDLFYKRYCLRVKDGVEVDTVEVFKKRIEDVVKKFERDVMEALPSTPGFTSYAKVGGVKGLKDILDDEGKRLEFKKRRQKWVENFDQRRNDGD